MVSDRLTLRNRVLAISLLWTLWDWIRSKVAELNAEKSETEKGLEYHHDIEEFVVRVFELLKKAQSSDDALAFQWRGL